MAVTYDHLRDNPGVIAPPPYLAGGALALGLLLDWILPAYLLGLMLTITDRIVIGLLLLIPGCLLPVAAAGMFESVGTNVEPWKPATALMTRGIYRWLRNPMYVGLILILSGIAFLLASDWLVVMTVVFAFVIHYGVVRREERYLEAKFGDAYRSYKASVPRYGFPFF